MLGWILGGVAAAVAVAAYLIEQNSQAQANAVAQAATAGTGGPPPPPPPNVGYMLADNLGVGGDGTQISAPAVTTKAPPKIQPPAAPGGVAVPFGFTYYAVNPATGYPDGAPGWMPTYCKLASGTVLLANSQGAAGAVIGYYFSPTAAAALPTISVNATNAAKLRGLRFYAGDSLPPAAVYMGLSNGALWPVANAGSPPGGAGVDVLGYWAP